MKLHKISMALGFMLAFTFSCMTYEEGKALVKETIQQTSESLTKVDELAKKALPIVETTSKVVTTTGAATGQPWLLAFGGALAMGGEVLRRYLALRGAFKKTVNAFEVGYAKTEGTANQAGADALFAAVGAHMPQPVKDVVDIMKK